jgi:hypothetical protein
VPFKTIEGKQKQLYPNPKEAKESTTKKRSLTNTKK